MHFEMLFLPTWGELEKLNFSHEPTIIMAVLVTFLSPHPRCMNYGHLNVLTTDLHKNKHFKNNRSSILKLSDRAL